MEKNFWWAYLHISGSLQLKRYFDQIDLVDADESPFVQERTGPFEAETREEAEKVAKKLLHLETL